MKTLRLVLTLASLALASLALASLALATLACFGGSAQAAGMMKLSTVVRRGTVTEKAPGVNLKVRAPLGTVLSRSVGGSTGTFAPYHGHSHLNRTKTGLIIELEPGRYFLSNGTNKGFTVTPLPAFQR